MMKHISDSVTVGCFCSSMPRGALYQLHSGSLTVNVRLCKWRVLLFVWRHHLT